MCQRSGIPGCILRIVLLLVVHFCPLPPACANTAIRKARLKKGTGHDPHAHPGERRGGMCSLSFDLSTRKICRHVSLYDAKRQPVRQGVPMRYDTRCMTPNEDMIHTKSPISYTSIGIKSTLSHMYQISSRLVYSSTRTKKSTLTYNPRPALGRGVCGAVHARSDGGGRARLEHEKDERAEEGQHQ